MNNYEAKLFEKHVEEYMNKYKNIKDAIQNLMGLITQNKELHGPHKMIMLDLLKEICDNVIVGNQHLVASFDSVQASFDDLLQKTKEL